MTVLTESPTTVFTPPTGGFAPAPAEARGTPRDAVRMLVAERAASPTPRSEICRSTCAPATWWW